MHRLLGTSRKAGSARGRAALGVILLLGPLLASGVGAGISVAAARSSTHPDFTVYLQVTPDEGNVPLVVTFTARPVTGTATWYAWSFGDGSMSEGAPSADSTVEHTYDAPGTFNASVVVSEASGDAGAWHDVTVMVAPLAVALSATPNTGTVPLTVEFQANLTGGTGTYEAFNWTFGNGAVGEGDPAFNSYTRAGHYRVEFNATDSSGAEVTDAIWVNLTAPRSGTGSTGGFSSDLLLLVGVLGFLVGAAVVLLLTRRPREEGGGSALTAEPSPPDVPTAPSEMPEALPTPPATPIEAAPVPVAPDAALAPAPPETTPAVAPPEDPPRDVPVSSAGPARSPPEPEALRVSERIVLHLAAQGALGPDEVAPIAFSQAGMAEMLGIRQNALTNVLRRLEAAEVLKVDVRHVAGKPRRMKVYRLTGRGEALARDLRRRGAGAGRREPRLPMAAEGPE